MIQIKAPIRSQPGAEPGEAFMKKIPGELAVTGGGSGTGIAALINKKTDIALLPGSERKRKSGPKSRLTPSGGCLQRTNFVITHRKPGIQTDPGTAGENFQRDISTGKESGKGMKISFTAARATRTFVFFREFVVKPLFSIKNNERQRPDRGGIQRDRRNRLCSSWLCGQREGRGKAG